MAMDFRIIYRDIRFGYPDQIGDDIYDCKLDIYSFQLGLYSLSLYANKWAYSWEKDIIVPDILRFLKL